MSSQNSVVSNDLKRNKRTKQNVKDGIIYGIIGLATAITISVLLFILGYIFINGFKVLDWHFITGDYDTVSKYVDVPVVESGSNNLGLAFEVQTVEGEESIAISKIEAGSKAKESTIAKKTDTYALKKGDVIKKIGTKSVVGMTIEEANQLIDKQKGDVIRLKIMRPGQAIFPMIVTTLMIIALSLVIACPIGVLAAIYLVEYAKPGRLVRVIRFGTESLAGIPSIIYGLFGMLFFGGFLGFKYSILSGALTVSIILLPVIIRQTEESLKAVPMTYREGSLGLGATKLQTIRKAVLPSAIPGIMVAIILSVGRIVGESAALLLTAGTVARIPSSIMESGATLTVKAYAVAKEEGNIAMACAIGTIIIIIIFILNTLSKIISRKFTRASRS